MNSNTALEADGINLSFRKIQGWNVWMINTGV